MKRTQKFLILLLVLTLGFFALLIPKVKITADDTYGVPAPIMRLSDPNYVKNYMSNIPEEAYDVANGAMSKNEAGYIVSSYLDIISEDGLKNYANEMYIDIPVGESVVLFLETAHENWDVNDGVPYTEFGLSIDSDDVTFALDAYMRDSYANQFTSGAASGLSFNWTESSSLYTYDNQTLGLNSNYRLPKLTFTANSACFARFEMTYQANNNNATEETKTLYIHAYDGAEPDYYGLQISVPENIDTVQYNDFYLLNLNEEDAIGYIALPFELSNSFRFSSNYSETISAPTNVQTYTGTVRVFEDQSQGYTLDYDDDNNPIVVFSEAGMYDLNVQFGISIDSDNEYNVGTRHIKVFCYSQNGIDLYDAAGDELDLSNVDLDEVSDISIYPYNLYFYFFPNLSVEITATNIETQTTSFISGITSPGDYDVLCTFTDAALSTYNTNYPQQANPVSSTFTKIVSMTVYKIYEPVDLVLSYNTTIYEEAETINVDLSQALNGNLVINNYDEITQAEGTVSFNFGNNGAELNSGLIPLSYASVGSNTLNVAIQYPEETYNYSFNIVINNDLSFIARDADENIINNSIEMELYDADYIVQVYTIINNDEYTRHDNIILSPEVDNQGLIVGYSEYDKNVYIESPENVGTYQLDINVVYNDVILDTISLEVVVNALPELNLVVQKDSNNLSQIIIEPNTSEMYDVKVSVDGVLQEMGGVYSFTNRDNLANVANIGLYQAASGDPFTAFFVETNDVLGDYEFTLVLRKNNNEVATLTMPLTIAEAVIEYSWVIENEEEEIDSLDLVLGDDPYSVYIKAYYGQEEIDLDDYTFSYEVMPDAGLTINNVVTEYAKNEFTIEPHATGIYHLTIIVMSGNDTIDTASLEINVTDGGPEIILKNNGVNVDNITLYVGDNISLNVYTLIDSLEEALASPYSIELGNVSSNLSVTLSASDGSTVNNIINITDLGVVGTYTFIIDLYNEEKIIETREVSVTVEQAPYDDSLTYVFLDGNNNVLTDQLTLEEGGSAILNVVGRKNNETILLDNKYQTSFSVNPQTGLLLTEVVGADAPASGIGVNAQTSGRYNLIAKIYYLGELKEAVVLNVEVTSSVNFEDYEFYFAIDSTSIENLMLGQNEQATVSLLYYYDGETNLATRKFDVIVKANNQRALTVTTNQNDYQIASDVIAGSFAVTAEIYNDGDLIATVALPVNVEQSSSDNSYYFVNENNVSINGVQKMDLNSEKSYRVMSSDGELTTGYSVVYESDLSVIAEDDQLNIHDSFTIYSSSISGIYGISAKIYYQNELIDSIILIMQAGEIPGSNEPIIFNGEFYFAEYEYTSIDGEELSIPLYYYDFETGERRIFNDQLLRLNVTEENQYFDAFFEEGAGLIRIMPRSSGSSTIDVLVIYNNQFITNLKLNIRIIFNRESIETTFAEGKMVQVLLATGEIYLTIPTEYEEDFYNSEIINISSNRNVCDVSEVFERRLLVQLINVGQSDVYLVLRNDYKQIMFKSTLSVINEEPHIDIDMRRENDSAAAISKFDKLTFSVNTLGFTFSGSVSYEWLLDDQVVGHDAKLTTTVPDGNHTIKVRFVDNVLNRHLEASKELNISKLPDQMRQLSFNENTIYLVMLKNAYDLQVYLDGMISNDYHYTWSVDDDTVSIYENGTSKLTILPNHAGTTTVYAFTNVGVNEEKIISASVTIVVEKIESIDYKLSQEFPKPGKPFDIILLVNGKDNFKNTDFQLTLTEDGTEVASPNDGNVFHVNEPKNAKYAFNYRLGNLENSGSVKVSNFNFREFLIKILPFVLVGIVIAVVVYTLVVRGLNPYRSLTNAMNALDNCFQKEIEKTDANPSKAAYTKSFKKLRSKNHQLRNRINYFSDEGFDGIESALKHVITIDAIFSSLIYTTDTISETDCQKAIHRVYDNNFAALKVIVNQTIDSQLHFQKQAIEANKEDNPKKQKVKKEKVDYKKELYKNGVLEHGDTEDNEE